MDEYKLSKSTEDFLSAMKAADMIPMCPECGFKCFAAKMAQTKEIRDAGTINLWCADSGHWAGDVRDAAWRHKSALNVA
jgi:hypothetical protein